MTARLCTSEKLGLEYDVHSLDKEITAVGAAIVHGIQRSDGSLDRQRPSQLCQAIGLWSKSIVVALGGTLSHLDAVKKIVS